jgi:hypothetical protein
MSKNRTPPPDLQGHFNAFDDDSDSTIDVTTVIQETVNYVQTYFTYEDLITAPPLFNLTEEGREDFSEVDHLSTDQWEQEQAAFINYMNGLRADIPNTAKMAYVELIAHKMNLYPHISQISKTIYPSDTPFLFDPSADWIRAFQTTCYIYRNRNELDSLALFPYNTPLLPPLRLN